MVGKIDHFTSLTSLKKHSHPQPPQNHEVTPSSKYQEHPHPPPHHIPPSSHTALDKVSSPELQAEKACLETERGERGEGRPQWELENSAVSVQHISPISVSMNIWMQ